MGLNSVLNLLCGRIDRFDEIRGPFLEVMSEGRYVEHAKEGDPSL
jgi:hypothetical protein